MEQIIIVRDRYQITIPDLIRKKLVWLAPQRVVSIKTISKEKILIEPYQEKNIAWDKIWQSFEKIQKSGCQFSSTSFISKDRKSH